jgi:predicted TIM-barrel fold metal-dependent hydrolase
MPRAYKCISGDTHLEIPNERWTHRVDKKYRDRAPKSVRLDTGADATVFEDFPPRQNTFDIYGGQGRDIWYPAGQVYETCAGTGSPQQRIKEQDQDGIDAEVMFPAVVLGPALWMKTKDDGLQKALIRGWNDWFGEEYLSQAKGRIFGIGTLTATGVDDCIAEMKHCKELGFVGMQLLTYPNGTGIPTLTDDRFWAAALDMDMPITIHFMVEGTDENDLLPNPKEHPIQLRTKLPIQMTRFARNAGFNAVQLILSGVFDRFPNLRIFCAENSIGWIPNFLEMCDVRYARHIPWAEKLNGYKPLKAKPSELINEYFYWGFQRDRAGIDNRHHLNVERLIWANDFPHQESDWPESHKVLENNFSGVPADEVHKMTVSNAVRFFRLP